MQHNALDGQAKMNNKSQDLPLSRFVDEVCSNWRINTRAKNQVPGLSVTTVKTLRGQTGKGQTVPANHTLDHFANTLWSCFRTPPSFSTDLSRQFGNKKPESWNKLKSWLVSYCDSHQLNTAAAFNLHLRNLADQERLHLKSDKFCNVAFNSVENLACETTSSTKNKSQASIPLNIPFTQFRSLLIAEAEFQLQHNIPSNRDFAQRHLAKALKNESFARRVSCSMHGDLSKSYESLTSSERLGILPRDIVPEFVKGLSRPLHIFIAPALIGTIAIFYYLKQFCNIPIDLNFSAAHSIDLIRQIESRNCVPDLCAVADAPAASILRGGNPYNYKLQLLLPNCRQRIVISKESDLKSFQQVIQGGTVGLFQSDYSTGTFALEEMARTSKLVIPNSRLVHVEPNEALSILNKSSKLDAVIMWSPHWSFAERVFKNSVVEPGQGCNIDYSTMLLAHADREGFEKPEFLHTLKLLIYDAWLRLNSHEVLSKTLDHLMSNSDYYEIALRVIGMKSFDCA